MSQSFPSLKDLGRQKTVHVAPTSRAAEQVEEPVLWV